MLHAVSQSSPPSNRCRPKTCDQSCIVPAWERMRNTNWETNFGFLVNVHSAYCLAWNSASEKYLASVAVDSSVHLLPRLVDGACTDVVTQSRWPASRGLGSRSSGASGSDLVVSNDLKKRPWQARGDDIAYMTSTRNRNPLRSPTLIVSWTTNNKCNGAHHEGLCVHVHISLHRRSKTICTRDRRRRCLSPRPASGSWRVLLNKNLCKVK